MWLLVLLAMVAARGEVAPFRPPVNGYAGLNPSGQQSVLIEPTPPPPTHSLVAVQNTFQPQLALQSRAKDTEAPNVSSLAQRLWLKRPKYSYRSVNGSSPFLQRLRQQKEGKRTSAWKTYTEGVGRRRVRPGVSRLGGGIGVVKRRRHPSHLSKRRTTPGVLRHRLAMPTTSHGKLNDYLVQWHSVYSSSNTSPVNTTTKHNVTTETPNNSNNNVATTQRLSSQQYNDVANGKTINNKPDFSLSTKPPVSTGSIHSVNVPYVHDMTSKHFSDVDTFSTGHNGETKFILNIKDSEDALRPKVHNRTTVAPMSPSSDGKEILGSIQSIFQAAKSDEGELTSMKTVSHGNASPKPLDIFSGISPTYGFQPSEQVHGLNSGDQESLGEISPLTQQESFSPSLQSDIESLYVSEVAPEPILAVPQQLTTGDFVVHVGRPLPVSSDQEATGPEHRLGGVGDILLNESDDIIVGRPATLIQALPEMLSPPLTTASPPIRHTYNNTLHFRVDQKHNGQNYQLETSPLSYRQENLGPLLNYIKTKYKPMRLPGIPSSVSSLQSIIQAGRVPQVFKQDEVLQLIHSDHQRFRRPPVNRLGEPWTTSVERVHVQPQLKTDTGGSGQFVALSSLALLAAFCGYLLFSSPGSSIESKIVSPIKDAVEEARSGLNLILQGLDEYEQHIDKENNVKEEIKTKLQQNLEDNAPEKDIPTILTKIWNTVVPPEVIISSNPMSNFAGERRHVDASALIRGHKRITSGFRQPHAIGLSVTPMAREAEVDAELRRINATINSSILRTTAGLSLAATSLVDRFISSKTVRKIISQLKIPIVNARRDTNQIQSQESENQNVANQSLTEVGGTNRDSSAMVRSEGSNIQIINVGEKIVAEAKEKLGKKNAMNETEDEILGEQENTEGDDNSMQKETDPAKEGTLRDGETEKKDYHTKEKKLNTTNTKQGTESPELVTFLHVETLRDDAVSVKPKKKTAEEKKQNEGEESERIGSEGEEKQTIAKANEEGKIMDKKDSGGNEVKEGTQKEDQSSQEESREQDDGETEEEQRQETQRNPFTSTAAPWTTSTKKLVILNNLLHVQHSLESQPPRTAAFLDNIPLRPFPHHTSFPALQQ